MSTTEQQAFDASPYVDLIQRSPFPIPDVRRAAIIESVRRAPNMQVLIDIFLEATTDSPYLTMTQKACLAERLLLSNSGDDDDDDDDAARSMDALAMAAGCSPGVFKNSSLSSISSVQRPPDRSFQRMARLLFHTSRKIRALPNERRRQLGAALTACTTADAVQRFVIEDALPSAIVLDPATRNQVALDSLEGRYYRLLLPDRLDCAEPQGRLRTYDHDEQDTCCPICLGDTANVDTIRTTTPATFLATIVVPCCHHVYCRSCLADWIAAARGGSDCPTCRQDLPRGLVDMAQPAQEPPLGNTRRHRWTQPC